MTKIKSRLAVALTFCLIGRAVAADEPNEHAIELARKFAGDRIETENQLHRSCYQRAIDGASEGRFADVKVERQNAEVTSVKFLHNGKPYDGCQCEVTVTFGSGAPLTASPQIIGCTGG